MGCVPPGAGSGRAGAGNAGSGRRRGRGAAATIVAAGPDAAAISTSPTALNSEGPLPVKLPVKVPPYY